jgi:Tfp pilus assembly protein PilO
MFDSFCTSDLKRRDCLWHATGLGVTVLVAAAAFALIYVPLERHRVALDRTARARRAFLARGDAIRIEHEELKSQQAATETRMAGLLKRIPVAPQEAEFLAELSSLAGETEFVIHEYRPGKVLEVDRHCELEVQLHAEGTYESLCCFLQGLERMERFCRLSDFGVSLRPESPMHNTVHLTLQIFFAARSQAANVGVKEAEGPRPPGLGTY